MCWPIPMRGDRARALAAGRTSAGHPATVRRGRARRDGPAQAARKILTYDDVLSVCATPSLDPERGPAACDRLRERYDVVLVDEFQDTDPVQWDIMHRPSAGAGPRWS